MTYDFVKRGEHADAGIGVRLPFIGQTISGRNLTADEKALVKNAIFKYYDTFVAKVAEGRGMTVEEIDSLGQGHFYSGLKGKEIGLVDDIGGLMKAVDIAVKEAGFESRDDVDLIEFPRSKGYFNLMKRFPPLPISVDEDPFYNYLRLALENPYQPLPMLYPGTYPDKEK
jgi:protease-4